MRKRGFVFNLAGGSGGGSSSITIGDAVASGAANRVLFEGVGNVLAENASFTFNGTTLGVPQIQLNSEASFLTGTGTPEAAVTATSGSLYLDNTAGAGKVYVKETDAGNTGWVELDKSTPEVSKYYVQQALGAGLNVITHNLNLSTPKAVVVQIRDNSTGEEISVPITVYTTNTLTLSVLAPVTLANITVIA